ncbi:MAG: SDR family oxidoreductase [Elusimicrobiota bacterium]|jgi:uncharacterized protein YbjT (DUF2867 family)
MASSPLILLTGASGYVGGRLLAAMERHGCRLRCLCRQTERLKVRTIPDTDIVQGDALDLPSLEKALEGVHTVYYLVHSMAAGSGFETIDRQAAHNFAEAAVRAKIRRIIYLGGLGDSRESLSSHLRSRQEVGDIFRASGIPVIEFRASIIIGSGSLSFEMVRALVERLPIMVTPRWVVTLAQPIAIEDVIAYLLAAADPSVPDNRIYEIGGADVVSYAGLMREYARQRGLHRLLISVPFLTPRLSSLWLGLVTPIYARVGRQLVTSLRHATVVRDASALQVFPIRPRGVHDAIRRALIKEDSDFAQTHWSDALSSAGLKRSWAGVRFGTRILDSRVAHVHRSPREAFRVIRRIGGDTGWYFGDWLWRFRGFLDLLVGGVGMRRGRRHPEWLRVGDTVDFYRVEKYAADRLLRLFAELKLPGRAWLQFEVEPDGQGSLIRQTAVFDPVGLWGLATWYLLYPFHKIVFVGMIHGIARAVHRQPNTF